MPTRSRFSLDIPQVVHGVQYDYKRLYYSNPDAALKVPVTLMAGYGIIEQGAMLAKNLSAAGKAGLLLPYNPTLFTGAEDHPGRAYLVANTGTTDKFVYVTQDDSYKFNVGDDLIINDNTTAKENRGAIVSIDRTSEQHRALITFTVAIGGVAYTTARKAYVCVEAGVATNNYSDCVGVLEKSVDCGTGINSAGAVATLILGNVVLYEGTLALLDAAAKVDISATSFGQYMYIR